MLIEEWLIANKIESSKNFQISSKSWLKAGGIIKNFITPGNIQDCIKLIKYINSKKIEFYILGNISNTILRDGEISTPVINLHKLSKISEENTPEGYKFKVNGGTSLAKFSKYVTKNGITGCEGLVGIPGTVGGGAVMNCSSYGSCISDYISSLECINTQGEIFLLKKKDCNFNFRKSIFQKDKHLIINVNFLFSKKNYIGKEKTDKKIQNIINHRNKFQEKKFPNLGSLFATKDLYKDLKNKNLFFFIIYFVYKILSFLVFHLSKKNFFTYRKIVVKIYEKLLGLDTSKKFSLSDRTINCLVNNGSLKADDAIIFVKTMKKKIGNCADLENIILEDIK